MARESLIQILSSNTAVTGPDDLSIGEFAYAGGSERLFIGTGKGAGSSVCIGAPVDEDTNLGGAGATHNALASQLAIKTYVDAQIGASAGVTSIETLTGSVDVTTIHGITHNIDGGALNFRGITATTSTPGVASFNSNNFSFTDAQVNAASITILDDDGDSQSFTLGDTICITGDNGILTNLITKAGNDATVNVRGINASTSTKGVASFNADDFNVNLGAVSLEDSVLKGITVDGSNVTPSTHRIEIDGGTAAVFNVSAAGFTIGVQQASTSVLGVAKFNSGDFAVDGDGEVTFIGSSGVSSVTGVTASGIRTDPTSGDVIIYGVTASTGGDLGVAAFSSTNFSINPSAGIVTIKDGGVANDELVNSSITISDGSGSTEISLGSGITIEGTATEVVVSETAGTVTIGLPTDVDIDGNLTVGGTMECVNLYVTGTATTVDTDRLVVEDPLIKLARNNATDSVDIGFYGQYDDSGTNYTGLARDATNGSYYLFDSLTTDPLSGTDNVVDVSGSSVATLVANISGGTF